MKNFFGGVFWIVDEIARENPDTRIYLDFCGEPLLIKYKLYYMIDYAKKAGINNVNFNTNAQFLDEETTEMILDSDLSYLSVDCDGFSKEVYESIRRGGKRDKFFKNVEYLLQRKKQRQQETPIVDVKIIEMPENQAEVATVMSYWQRLGAWTAKRRQYSWGGSNEHANLTAKDFRIACGRALGICTVTWDGKVTNCACDFDGTVIWGDLNVDSLKDVWQKRNAQMVQHHFSHEWDKLPAICRQCNDWQIVGEERFDENGNPVNKNYKQKGTVFA